MAVLFLDVVIGYGAHPDPAAELGPAIDKAHKLARQEGHELLVIASVTGTKDDPQGLLHTRELLQKFGTIVCDSNAAAARLAAFVLSDDYYLK